MHEVPSNRAHWDDNWAPDDSAVRRMLCGEWVTWRITRPDGSYKTRSMRFVIDQPEIEEEEALPTGHGGYKVRYERQTTRRRQVQEVLPA